MYKEVLTKGKVVLIFQTNAARGGKMTLHTRRKNYDCVRKVIKMRLKLKF